MSDTPADDARLAALEQRIEELERTQAQLQQRLADDPHPSGDTMRKRLVCPACGGRKFVHAVEILDRGDGGRYSMAVLQPSVWRSKGLGEFEVFICLACGLAEWYVREPEELEDAGEHLRVVDGSLPGGGGPFR
jgi:hypothetical protein